MSIEQLQPTETNIQHPLAETDDLQDVDVWEAELVADFNNEPVREQIALEAARQGWADLQAMRATVEAFVATSRSERDEFLEVIKQLANFIELVIKLKSQTHGLTEKMSPAIIGADASIPNIASQIHEKGSILLHLEQYQLDLDNLEDALRLKIREIEIVQRLIASRESGPGSLLPDVSRLGNNAQPINDMHIERAKGKLPTLLAEKDQIINEIAEKKEVIISTSRILAEEAQQYLQSLTESHENRVSIIDANRAKAAKALAELGQSVVANTAVRSALMADPNARRELLQLPDVRAALIGDREAMLQLFSDPDFTAAAMDQLLIGESPKEISTGK